MASVSTYLREIEMYKIWLELNLQSDEVTPQYHANPKKKTPQCRPQTDKAVERDHTDSWSLNKNG